MIFTAKRCVYHRVSTTAVSGCFCFRGHGRLALQPPPRRPLEDRLWVKRDKAIPVKISPLERIAVRRRWGWYLQVLRANTRRAANDEPGRQATKRCGQVSDQDEHAVPRHRPPPPPPLEASENQGSARIAGDGRREPALTRQRRTQVCGVWEAPPCCRACSAPPQCCGSTFGEAMNQQCPKRYCSQTYPRLATFQPSRRSCGSICCWESIDSVNRGRACPVDGRYVGC